MKKKFVKSPPYSPMHWFSNSILFCLFLVASGQVMAQKEPAVAEPFPIVALPDSLSGKDAVVMSENYEFVHRTAVYKDQFEVILGTQKIHKQVLILTQNGLRQYAYISIPKTKYTEIEEINLFLIKPDGTIQKVTAEMREILDAGDDDKMKRGDFRISIPGAEVGDRVDFSVTISNPAGGGYPMNLFFHDRIPTLNSTTTLRIKKNLKFLIHGYNGLAINREATEVGDSIFTWKFAYIPAILGEEECIKENELPFCRYMITDILKPNGKKSLRQLTPPGWGILFKPYVESMNTSPGRTKKSDYFDEFIGKVLHGYDTSSKLTCFSRVFHAIRDSVELVESDNFKSQSSGYYLWEKKIDRSSLYLLYKNLFNHFGYKSYLVFARSRYNGVIDSNWISRDFFSAILLGFRDETGGLHFIQPATKNKQYFIDEIDPDLMGTNAFLVEVDNAFAYSLITLPASGYEKNMKSRRTSLDVGEKTSAISVSSTYTGTYSTMERIREELNDKDSLLPRLKEYLRETLKFERIDTLFSTGTDDKPPFAFTRSYKGIQQHPAIALHDSIFTVPMEGWIDHNTVSTDRETRNLDYYVLYPFTEKIVVEYRFPSPVLLLNQDGLNTHFDNDFSSYHVLAEAVDSSSIRVTSEYCIKSLVIPSSGYLQLKELNNLEKQFRGARLLVGRVSR